MADKWVYDFAEGSKEMRDLLGGKGANVAEMTRVLGADRVPAGFTITTEACVAYMRAGRTAPDGLGGQVQEALQRLQVQGLARGTDNERCAWDSYRRFVQMFGNVVRGIPGERFEEAIKAAKRERGI